MRRQRLRAQPRRQRIGDCRSAAAVSAPAMVGMTSSGTNCSLRSLRIMSGTRPQSLIQHPHERVDERGEPFQQVPRRQLLLTEEADQLVWREGPVVDTQALDDLHCGHDSTGRLVFVLP
jgi:hypothetical protein